MLIKSELQKAGYRTWMDIDKMSGSTLEVSMQRGELGCWAMGVPLILVRTAQPIVYGLTSGLSNEPKHE
jgi:hypothetical protein